MLGLSRSVRAPSWADVLPRQFAARSCPPCAPCVWPMVSSCCNSALVAFSSHCWLPLNLPFPFLIPPVSHMCFPGFVPFLASFPFQLMQSPWVISSTLAPSAAFSPTAVTPGCPQATCMYTSSCPPDWWLAAFNTTHSWTICVPPPALPVLPARAHSHRLFLWQSFTLAPPPVSVALPQFTPNPYPLSISCRSLQAPPVSLFSCSSHHSSHLVLAATTLNGCQAPSPHTTPAHAAIVLPSGLFLWTEHFSSALFFVKHSVEYFSVITKYCFFPYLLRGEVYFLRGEIVYLSATL